MRINGINGINGITQGAMLSAPQCFWTSSFLSLIPFHVHALDCIDLTELSELNYTHWTEQMWIWFGTHTGTCQQPDIYAVLVVYSNLEIGYWTWQVHLRMRLELSNNHRNLVGEFWSLPDNAFGALDSYFYILTRTRSERRGWGCGGGVPRRTLESGQICGVK